MNRVARIRAISAAATFVVAQLVSACVSPAPTMPWDRPVDGASSVTDWIDEQPIGEEVFETTDAVLEAVREIEMGTWGVRAEDVSVGTVGDEGDTTLIGYARTSFTGSGHAMRAVDVRLELRQVAGGWVVGEVERRYHCATDTATALCE
jgi:hypothetical protein